VNREETVTLITWINQHDPRVQVNVGARDIWAHSLADPISHEDAKQAVLEHYRANDAEAANPGTIRKRALQIRSLHTAETSAEFASENRRALEASDGKTKRSWRARNPELWDQLFEQGRQEGNAARKAATERRAGL
jgi:hypothetical protein